MTLKHFIEVVKLTLLISFSHATWAGEPQTLVDDFNSASQNNMGFERLFIDDTSAGGKTKTHISVNNGLLSAKGDIVPPRGQPGWASSVLPLNEFGKQLDASQYQGIVLKVKINQGMLSVSANSSAIDNFDYHALPIMIKADGQFHTVKLPFKDMKRAWSAQTPLDPKTLNSLSIVAFSLQQAKFDYQIDEIGFY